MIIHGLRITIPCVMVFNLNKIKINKKNEELKKKKIFQKIKQRELNISNPKKNDLKLEKNISEKDKKSKNLIKSENKNIIQENLLIAFAFMNLIFPSIILRKQLTNYLTLKYSLKEFKLIYNKSHFAFTNYFFNKRFMMIDLIMNRFFGEFMTFLILQNYLDLFLEIKKNVNYFKMGLFIGNMAVIQIAIQILAGNYFLKFKKIKNIYFFGQYFISLFYQTQYLTYLMN